MGRLRVLRLRHEFRQRASPSLHARTRHPAPLPALPVLVRCRLPSDRPVDPPTFSPPRVRRIYGVKWRCGDGTSSESFGYKMVGLSRTGATGSSYEKITYGVYCRYSRTDNAIINWGTESGYDVAGDNGVAQIDVSKFLDGTGYTKDDVFSMKFVGTVLHVRVPPPPRCAAAQSGIALPGSKSLRCTLCSARAALSACSVEGERQDHQDGGVGALKPLAFPVWRLHLLHAVSVYFGRGVAAR